MLMRRGMTTAKTTQRPFIDGNQASLKWLVIDIWQSNEPLTPWHYYIVSHIILKPTEDNNSSAGTVVLKKCYTQLSD